MLNRLDDKIYVGFCITKFCMACRSYILCTRWYSMGTHFCVTELWRECTKHYASCVKPPKLLNVVPKLQYQWDCIHSYFKALFMHAQINACPPFVKVKSCEEKARTQVHFFKVHCTLSFFIKFMVPLPPLPPAPACRSRRPRPRCCRNRRRCRTPTRQGCSCGWPEKDCISTRILNVAFWKVKVK